MSKSTAKTRSRKDDKPKKPYPDYPLYPHPLGYWSKKIKGKQCTSAAGDEWSRAS
jgi:hypothetical protein